MPDGWFFSLLFFLLPCIFLAFFRRPAYNESILPLPTRRRTDARNKKKLRNILLPIVIIAVIVACYVGYFMRTQPLLDCMTGTDIPSTGEITRYDEAHKDGVSLAVTSPDQVSGLWQAIQDTEVRFVRGRGTAVAPPGGVYYEVSLTSADGASVYGFGCNSNEDLVIQGSAYVIVGESQILQALDALFPDSAE